MQALLNRNSLLSQLLLRIFAIGVGAIILTFAFIHFQIDRSLEALRDETVEEQAVNLANYLHREKGGAAQFTAPEQVRRFYANAGPAYQYLILDRNGKILFRSPFAYNSYFPADLTRDNARFDFKGPAGFDYVGYTLGYPLEGNKYYIQVAQTKQAAETLTGRITGNFMTRLMWIGIPFYAALFWIVMTTLKRKFQPLYSAAREVSQVNAQNPDIQISEKSVPDEVRPFVHAVNVSFERLSRSIREQREFTENLAHELRTPLAVLKTHIELLGRGALADKIGQDVNNMIQLVNQMLDMTRLDNEGAIEMGAVDLTEIVSQVCRDLWPLFLKSQRELRVNGMSRPVLVTGNKDLIYRAVRNLLDNALEYSPAKTPVDVDIVRGSVRVRDYGATIPADMREKIFERSQRKGSRPGRSRNGAGLGLSIVRRTMEVHGGTALLEPADDAGNIFFLNFSKMAPLGGKMFEVRSL